MDDHTIEWGVDRVREAMRKRIDEMGVSRYEVSESAGVNRSHLYSFLRGDCGISFESLFRICFTLDLDPCSCFPTMQELTTEFNSKHPFG